MSGERIACLPFSRCGAVLGSEECCAAVCLCGSRLGLLFCFCLYKKAGVGFMDVKTFDDLKQRLDVLLGVEELKGVQSEPAQRFIMFIRT